MCDTSEAPQCKHFLAGRCNRASCRFVHSSEGLNRGSGVQPAVPVPAGALETLPPQPGAWLQVEGRRAEVVRLGKRKLRVRFDDGSRQWVALEEVPAKSAARETPKPCVAPAVAARPGRALPLRWLFPKPLAVTAGGAGTERGVVRLGCTQTSGFAVCGRMLSKVDHRAAAARRPGF